MTYGAKTICLICLKKEYKKKTLWQQRKTDPILRNAVHPHLHPKQNASPSKNAGTIHTGMTVWIVWRRSRKTGNSRAGTNMMHMEPDNEAGRRKCDPLFLQRSGSAGSGRRLRRRTNFLAWQKEEIWRQSVRGKNSFGSICTMKPAGPDRRNQLRSGQRISALGRAVRQKGSDQRICGAAFYAEWVWVLLE